MIYSQDPFSKDALLDLRGLNEREAGVNGRIRLSVDGQSFVTQNGKPIRFWAVNGGELSKKFNDEELATFARFMAKMGVNLIRFHGDVMPKNADSKITDVDTAEVKAIWRTVAAMKKEGIYSVISPFWPGFVKNIPEAWALGDYKGKVKPWALLYFEPRLQEAYQSWVKYLYTTRNPYTGIALKDDPAVAVIQIQNEDGLLFWTVQDVQPSLQRVMEKSFYEWILAKYGTIEAAYRAWNNEKMEHDLPAEKRLGIYKIYEATRPDRGTKAGRIADQVAFLSQHQRKFYDDVAKFYRQLGCEQLISGNNWKTASAIYLNDAERWTNAGVEVMAVNRYYEPKHRGEFSGWRIDPGHNHAGKSVLVQPSDFTINIKQVHNKPFFVTEGGWNLPNKYQSEGPFLISAYMSLNGVDGFFWFNATTAGVDPSPYFHFIKRPDSIKAMHRWTISTPGQVMMFPAAALAFRQGYIKESKPVVAERRPLAALWQGETPLLAEENSFDPNRDQVEQKNNADEMELTPLAYLAGKVTVEYGPDEKDFVAQELPSLIQSQQKQVRSSTNELVWDYGAGICTLNAPAAQGATGFLGKKKTIALKDMKIFSTDEYATIMAVSMDGLPFSTSKKILLQCGTTYRPTGWVEKPTQFTIQKKQYDGFEIVDTGRMPWRGKNLQASIEIKNNLLRKATLLNLHGEAEKNIQVKRGKGTFRIQIPPNAFYVILSE